MRKIALIGLPGSGKSSVGRQLATTLSYAFIDLDAEIVQREGRSIPDIFAEVGESGFRNMEETVLRSLYLQPGTDGIILATGGGVVVTDACRTLLRESWISIYLEATLATLVTRLSSERSGRPLLQGTDALEHRLQTLLGEREALYKRAAQHIVTVDDKLPIDIAQEIIAIIHESDF